MPVFQQHYGFLNNDHNGPSPPPPAPPEPYVAVAPPRQQPSAQTAGGGSGGVTWVSLPGKEGVTEIEPYTSFDMVPLRKLFSELTSKKKTALAEDPIDRLIREAEEKAAREDAQRAPEPAAPPPAAVETELLRSKDLAQVFAEAAARLAWQVERSRSLAERERLEARVAELEAEADRAWAYADSLRIELTRPIVLSLPPPVPPAARALAAPEPEPAPVPFRSSGLPWYAYAFGAACIVTIWVVATRRDKVEP